MARAAVSATLARSGWRWAAILLSVVIAILRPDLPVTPLLLLTAYFVLSMVILVTSRRQPSPHVLALLDIVALSAATLAGGGQRSPINVIYLTTMLDVGSRMVVRQAGVLATGATLGYMLAAWIASAAEADAFDPTLAAARGFLFIAAALTSSSLGQAASLARLRATEANTLNTMMRLTTAASLDMEAVLETIIQQACKGVQADCGVILLHDGRDARESKGYGLLEGEVASLKESTKDDILCQQALAAGRVVSPTGHGCPVVAALHPKARAAACAPLILEQEVIGCLWVARRSGQTFSGAEANLLGLMGQQAALAVRNARFHALEKHTVAQLRAAEQAKTEFLSTVSHELRTPLTAIKASAGLLLDSGENTLTPTQMRLVRSIARNADRLSGMVGDLLDLARLQSGRLPLTCELIDIRPIIHSSVEAMRPLMEQKQQTVTVRLPHALPRLMADRRRLEQILTNLLSNAHRYTPPGGHVSVVVTEQDDTLEVSVADDGPAVPIDERDLIFERFYRGAAARRTEPGGAGLGLAVTRSLVELHGGSIGYREATGGGSEFYFRLPLNGPQEAEP